MTGDFTSSFKAFEKLNPRNIFRSPDSYQKDLFEILDVFDGTVDIIEQSIIGDVKGAYKKVKTFAEWLLVNIEKQSDPERAHEWSTYG